jgi:hypothetical protein
MKTGQTIILSDFYIFPPETGYFIIDPATSTSNLPVSYSVVNNKVASVGLQDSTNETGSWVLKYTGVVPASISLKASQAGNSGYYAAPNIFFNLQFYTSGYNINIEVNKFFEQRLLLANTGIIYISTLPSGVVFNKYTNYIYGSALQTGRFVTNIYQQGSNNVPYATINFNIKEVTNTGYMYCFGPGFGYAENGLPVEFQNTIVNNILCTNKYNIAISPLLSFYNSPLNTGGANISTSTSKNEAEKPYSFILKNNSNRDCIENFIFSSTLTGNFSGYLDNDFYFNYEGGTPGTMSQAAVLFNSEFIDTYSGVMYSGAQACNDAIGVPPNTDNNNNNGNGGYS